MCVCFSCLEFLKQLASAFFQKPIISYSPCAAGVLMCHVLASVSSGFQIVTLVVPKRFKLGETVPGLYLRQTPDEPEHWMLSKTLCFCPGIGVFLLVALCHTRLGRGIDGCAEFCQFSYLFCWNPFFVFCCPGCLTSQLVSRILTKIIWFIYHFISEV